MIQEIPKSERSGRTGEPESRTSFERRALQSAGPELQTVLLPKTVPPPASLVVFADDWGRHPSSCQHLIRQLLPKYPVLWVNTIGTRAPRCDLATVRRVCEKLSQWRPHLKAKHHCSPATDDTPAQLTVTNPWMWPWFRRPFDRGLNRVLLTRQLTPLLQQLPQPVHAVTTLPITADLPGELPVQHWTYYCVDDFGAWPGLDGNTLRQMDQCLIRNVDSILAVSETLQLMIATQQRTSTLLTHGVDLDHWRHRPATPGTTQLLSGLPRPLVLFWGVVDRRLDSVMLKTLSARLSQGTIVLVGPQQDPDPEILRLQNVAAVPAVPYPELPELADQAAVLVMPYADLPVTRAMQPLKLKEYLATGKPVVASRLPAVQDWTDCLDAVTTAQNFADSVCLRLSSGVPAAQQRARQRLNSESWTAKSRVFEQCLTRLSAGPRRLTQPAGALLT